MWNMSECKFCTTSSLTETEFGKKTCARRLYNNRATLSNVFKVKVMVIETSMSMYVMHV